MTSLTIIDTEATARNWARAETHIATALGSTKVFFSTPIAFNKVPSAVNPTWIVLTLVSETFQQGDFGMQLAVVQFDCYGKDKATAATTALAVETAARLISYGSPVTVGAVVIAWADVQLKRWLPDPSMNMSRYVVDVQFAMHGAEA